MELLVGLAITAVVGAVSLCCVAHAVATFIRSAEASQPAVQLILLPLYFISGVFVPWSEIPSWLASIANVFPIRHLTSAFVTAYDPTTTGAGINWSDLGVLAAWAVGGLFVALIRFSWLPRSR